MPAVAPQEDDVFVHQTIDRFRRVVRVLDGQVVYCNGGNKLHRCNLKTFSRWVRRATIIHRRG